MEKTLSERIISCILGIIASTALCMGVMPSLRIRLPFFSVLISVTLIILLIFVISYNKYTSVISLLLAIFIFTILYFKVFNTAIFKQYFNYITNWVIAPDLIPKAYDNFYSVLAEWVVVFLISIFTYLYLVRLSSFAVYTIGVTALYIGLWIQDYKYLGIPFFVSLALIFTYYLKDVYHVKYINSYTFDKKEKKKNIYNKFMLKPSYMSAIFLPIGLLTLLLVMKVPMDNKPLLGDLAYKIQDVISDSTQKIAETIGSDFIKESLARNFSLSSNGFGDSKKLGGNVRNSDKHVLTVESPYQNIYLEGSSNNIYTGVKWEKTSSDMYSFSDDKEYTFYAPYLERIAGLYMTTNRNLYENLTNDLKPYTVNVRFEDLLTKSVFTLPNKESLKVSDENGFKLLQSSNELLVGSKALSNGFSYEVTSFLPIEWSPDMIKAAQLSRRNIYRISSFNEVRTKEEIIELPNEDKQYMADRADLFYGMYLQLPASLPKRVIDLARSITKDCKTNYDKAKAIETYLSMNYKYTLTPGDVPDGVDFVDYFLFEKKEGYCVYYATAMTVLLRCIDVPARYVEGFKLPEKKGDSNSYKVTLKEGHAWPEVYFEGLGFMIFEPTTIYTNDFYTKETIASPKITSTPSPTKNTPGITSSQTPDITPDASQATPTLEIQPSPSNSNGVVGNNNNELNINPFLTVMIFILSMLLVLLAVIFINYCRYRHFTHKAVIVPYSASICYVFKKFIGIIGFCYDPILNTETLLEYRGRLIALNAFTSTGFQQVYDDACDIFINVRYTNNEATADMAWAMLKCYMQLIVILKLENGKLWYLVQRYLTGRL